MDGMADYHAPVAGLPTPNGYSHAVTANGPIVVISGQLPVDATGALVGTAGLDQARQVFANLDTALRAAGAYRANLIRLGCFLTDLADLDAFRQARDEYLGDGPRPASTLVQVAALVVPGARIEIDALAGA